MIRNKDIEDEANLFALYLLMPEQFFAEDMKQPIDLCDDDYIKKLAKKYDVSISMIVKRIQLFNADKIKISYELLRRIKLASKKRR